MWSSEEYDKKINEFMRRAGQLEEETPDETETELQKQLEEELDKIDKMIARETPLKPCPFCGGKAHIMHMGFPHWIYCEECGAKVHGRTMGEVEGVRASAKIWNSRIDFLPRAPHGEWIPITYRPMDEEEYEEFRREVGELPVEHRKMFSCHMPDDGQEILISTPWGGVSQDICEIDEYGYALENQGDWDCVEAWMPLPKPYKKEGDEE